MAIEPAPVAQEPEEPAGLPGLLERLVAARDGRTERDLAEVVARHGVRGEEDRVLRALPRIASRRARATLRAALRDAGHSASRAPRHRLRSLSRRARVVAASLCLGLGAAWLTVALLAGARSDWAAFAVATLVFFAVVAILGSYLGGRRATGAELPPGPPARSRAVRRTG